VVFDPSCEIGPIMTEALQAQDCHVYTIGLTEQGINALDWIDIKHPESDAHIRTAVDWIYNEGATHRDTTDQGRDPFWGTWGRALCTLLIAHMLHTPGAPKTLAYLRRGIATPESDMPAMLEGIYAGSPSRMARDLAGGLKGMKAEKTFSGIYANAFAATEWMSVSAYADVVSGNAMRTSAILNRNTVVFVQLPLRTLLVTPAVGRAVMGALFNAMFHADGSGGSNRILFELDEAWVLGRLKEIMLCHTTARKYRGAVHTLWQSEGQLEQVWGKEGAKTMRDTVSWRSYNAIQDGDVAERLSRDLGEHAVLAYSEGQNASSQRPAFAWVGSQSRGDNTNVHEIKRRLLKADEIMRAPADEMWVLARNFERPIRCYTAPYYRYPEIARRMHSNRFGPTAAE
jgi:type IV secretion system protein VirD4